MSSTTQATRRNGGHDREPVAKQGSAINSIQTLIRGCNASEICLYTASEHMQNPGLKLLFKRFAEQHRRNAAVLAELADEADRDPSGAARFSHALQRGWMDNRIALIVGRANRQTAAAQRCVAAERTLLQAYDEALAGGLPQPARTLVTEQREGIQAALIWLKRMAQPRQWIVRLVQDGTQATQAAEALRDAGFKESEIELTPVHQLGMGEEDAELRVRSTRDATLVAGLIGAVLGLVAGPLVGYAVPLFVPAVPATQYALWVSILAWGLIGILIGAFFGSFFGLVIGSAVSEDDAELVEMTSTNDAYLVSVPTTEENRGTAAQILQLRHERELDATPPKTA